jgi:hypothetical protein
MTRIGNRFSRVEPRYRARTFVLGLLAELPRKNCWTIAEHAGDPSPDCPRGRFTRLIRCLTGSGRFTTQKRNHPCALQPRALAGESGDSHAASLLGQFELLVAEVRDETGPGLLWEPARAR